MAALNAGMTSAGDDIKEEAGYAKLQGEHFDYFMQAHSIILGRSSKKEKVDLDMSVLGGGMDISRRHARIFYDFQCRQFALEVLGSNGCMVQGVLYLPGDGPVKLNSQDLLQIGQIKFYFLLPIRSIEATAAAWHTHIPLQPLSSSFMRSAHPHSSDVRDYGNDYGRDKGDNGIRVGTEAQGKFMKQSKRSSGELGIYSRYPIIVEPVGALGERVNKLQIRRADKDTDNKQLLLKEEKDLISYVATLASDSCGPGEWMPVAKLHSEVTIPALASIYNEKALKSQFDTSIYLQNLLLYGCGAIFNFLGLVITAIIQGPSSFNILEGHSKATMFLICSNAAQGILSSFFFKYADTILKKYSSTVATIFTGVASAVLFGHTLTINFILGISIVIISMHQYLSNQIKDEVPSSKTQMADTQDHRLKKSVNVTVTDSTASQAKHRHGSDERQPLLPV